jgi:hypothetical protein
MARKKRKAPVGKKKKRSEASTRKTTQRSKARGRRKRQPQSLGARVKGAYRTIVDTIKDTDQLRNKMEPPATSETE